MPPTDGEEGSAGVQSTEQQLKAQAEGVNVEVTNNTISLQSQTTFADQVPLKKGPASSSLCNAASGQKRAAAQHDDSKRCPFSDPKGSDGFCFLPIFTVRPLLPPTS
jgi:hypothetical protein